MSQPTDPNWKQTGELRAHVRAQAPPRPRKGPLTAVTTLVAALVVIWAFEGSNFHLGELIKDAPKMGDTLARMVPPDFKQVSDIRTYSFPEQLSMGELALPMPLNAEKAKIKRRWWNNTFPNTIVGAILQTIQMALAGTLLALLFAFPLCFLTAGNTSPHPLVYRGVRFIINFLRTVPELALGLLFVSAVGLGPLAGTLALAVHTMTVLTKLLSESAENIDQGVVEAIRATGANYFQTLSFAVLPQMLPDLISFTLYRFETNIRAASVLALIGAGGIGNLLNTSFRTFQYQSAATIVLILIVLVMAVDWCSSRLRKWVI